MVNKSKVKRKKRKAQVNIYKSSKTMKKISSISHTQEFSKMSKKISAAPNQIIKQITPLPDESIPSSREASIIRYGT